MEKSEYIAIRDRLSFSKPLKFTLLTIAVQCLLFVVAIWLLMQDHWAHFIVSQLLLALFFFHSFAMLHEAGHGNLYKKRWANRITGHFFSVFCFMPFFSWQHMHRGHHVYTGSINNDPGSRTLRKIKKLGRVPSAYQVCWRFWAPMVAIAQHVMLWFYPYRIWREEPENKELLRQTLFSTAFLIICYATFAHLFPEVVTIKNFGLSVFLYLVLTEIINAPHHVGMPHFYSIPKMEKLKLWNQHISTRSCRYPGVFSELITLNFSLHTEHHYFPTLPWYRLKKARDLIKPTLGEEYNEVGDFVWNWENRKVPAAQVVLSNVSHPLLDDAASEPT